MAAETLMSESKSKFEAAYDRLYAITKELHDTFESGELTIKQSAFEEMIFASQSLLVECQSVIQQHQTQTVKNNSKKTAPQKQSQNESDSKGSESGEKLVTKKTKTARKSTSSPLSTDSSSNQSEISAERITKASESRSSRKSRKGTST